MPAYDLALITPTADQPLGFALCEQMMREQSVWDSLKIQWLVADDGDVKATPTLGQTHIVRERVARESSTRSLCRNLLAAVPHVDAEYIAIIEHDDYYKPNHLELLLSRLRKSPAITGPTRLHYYHLGFRCWRVYNNRGIAALCQTGLRASLLPLLREAATECLKKDDKGVDGRLWKLAPSRAAYEDVTVIGMKGLPGRPGIGLGHVPDAQWRDDGRGDKLREWVGDRYAALYEAMRAEADPARTPPRVGWTMRTVNRRPRRENYLRATVTRLAAQGATGLHLQPSQPDVAWLDDELRGFEDRVVVHAPEVVLNPNETALRAVRVALDADPSYDWVVLLEDDLNFCTDFQAGVARWLARHGTPDRNIFRFFGFHVPPNKGRRTEAFDHPLDGLRASQATALRRGDAEDFLRWGEQNAIAWRRPGRADPGIAFDKFLASWSEARWPGRPGVLSWPFHVDHVGEQSSLHRRGVLDHRFFGGPDWIYR